MSDKRPIFMTPQQVAELLHVPASTLAYWRVLGGDHTPMFLKLGRHILYAEHHVEEWALAQARKSTAEQFVISQRRKAAAAAAQASFPALNPQEA